MAWKELKECILEEGITSHGATSRRKQGEEKMWWKEVESAERKRKGCIRSCLMLAHKKLSKWQRRCDSE